MKKRKAIGFKSLQLNCWDITQVLEKREMSITAGKKVTSYLIKSHLLKRLIY